MTLYFGGRDDLGIETPAPEPANAVQAAAKYDALLSVLANNAELGAEVIRALRAVGADTDIIVDLWKRMRP
jgi:hypothetical protein